MFELDEPKHIPNWVFWPVMIFIIAAAFVDILLLAGP